MGEHVGNVYPKPHGQPAGPVKADRKIRFHFGDEGIDQTLSMKTHGALWVAIVDAVRDQEAQDFADAMDDLQPLTVISATDWATHDWSDAVHAGFVDGIRPT